jgi:type IV secretory pathway VirJ component
VRVAVEAVNDDRFGGITVYRGSAHPRDVVLLISGDEGLDATATALARRLADKGELVAGIDIRPYRERLLKSGETCVSPASDLDNLSHALQSKLGLKRYRVPTLVGVASGAGLVHAALAAAPDGRFKGALSIGLCPDLDFKKPLCPGSPRPSGQWIVLQGENDTVCPVASVRTLAGTIHGSEVVVLTGAGHDYATRGWLPQFDSAFARVVTPRPDAKTPPLPTVVADLPLTIVGSGDEVAGDWFGVFLTGDGGWTALDKGVAAELARHNIPIVGWNSLKYFWSRRTPEGTSHDLDRVVRHYSHAWGRPHVLLIGYSQGADTMPFMINRLPPATHDLIGFTALLGISDNALFEFHVATWFGNPFRGLPTGPELARWSGAPYLCLYGESDRDAACAQLTGADGSMLKMPGGHHFGGSYARIAAEILARLPQIPAASPTLAR